MKPLLHRTLSNIVESNHIKRYLEIGTREGCSLRNVIEGNNNLEEIFISDIWGSDYGGSGRQNHNHISNLLTLLKFSGKVVYLDGDSKVTVPTLQDDYRDYFDLVLVDGDHSYDGGMADLRNVFGLVKNKGIIVFDDINHPSHMYLENCFDDFVTTQYNHIESTKKIKEDFGIGIIYKK